MNIGPTITVNIPGIQSQANNLPDVSTQTNAQTNAQNGNNASVKQTNQKQSQSSQSSTKSPLNQPVIGANGVIELDDEKNVVIRFYDSTGKMVAQYPPESYLEMMKELNQVTGNLFNVKA